MAALPYQIADAIDINPDCMLPFRMIPFRLAASSPIVREEALPFAAINGGRG
jgi:hypothetical protein